MTPGPAMALLGAARALAEAIRPRLATPPGARVYRVLAPLDYARANHEAYIGRYASAPIDAVLFGMNPGPWGMAQTGIPFGDPGLVRDFLAITGPVDRPAGEHPRCPVLGVASPRGEVSGRRLWGGARRCFGTPEAFFTRFFVANYCPLLFLDERGANVTPDKVARGWMAPVLDACDEHARAVCRALRPRLAIGIGAWATKRLRVALEPETPSIEVATVLHPSPASPAANRGWLEAARRQLDALGCPWPVPAAE